MLAFAASLFAAPAVLAQVSGGTVQPGPGPIATGCVNTTPCIGTCPARYTCTPRLVSTHVYMVGGGRGDWESSGVSCGKCIRVILGIPISGRNCGSNGLGVCVFGHALNAIENDSNNSNGV